MTQEPAPAVTDADALNRRVAEFLAVILPLERHIAALRRWSWFWFFMFVAAVASRWLI